MTTPPPESPTATTLFRDRIVVTLAAIACVVGTLLGMGVVGGSGVAEQGNGLFSDSATLIAPHGPAFSIWPVIYLLLAAYVVWQWTPPSSRSRWAAVTRLPAATSMLLNGVWLLVVFAGRITLSVAVIVGIAAALGVILHRTSGLRGEGRATGVIVGVTFGVYLGWVCVATCANVALWLISLGVEPAGAIATTLTYVVLVVVVALAAFLLTRTPHASFRIGIAAAIAWGLGWVAVGRLTGDLIAPGIGYAAAAAAGVVLVLLPAAGRLRSSAAA